MARHILIAEDEPIIRETLRFLLTHEGWRVESVADGDSVMRAVRSRRPALIVLDVMMPGRSGFDILRMLRADPDLARIPVLILTARGQSHDRQMACDLKADGFITKPFANDQLIEEVRRLLTLRGVGTLAG